MKTYFITIAVAIFGLISVNAQSINFGAKAGTNLSSLVGEDMKNSKMRTTYYVGAFANFTIKDKLYFQPEVLYSAQGSDFTEDDVLREYFDFSYLNIPLMLQYGVTDHLRVEFGPQLGILTSAKYKANPALMFPDDIGTFENKEKDIKDRMNALDIGLNIGGSYILNNGIQFNVRYCHGLNNVFDTSDDALFSDIESRNRVLAVGIGYGF